MITSQTIRHLAASVVVLLFSACAEEITGPETDSSRWRIVTTNENSQARPAEPSVHCDDSGLERPNGSIPEKNCNSGEVDVYKP